MSITSSQQTAPQEKKVLFEKIESVGKITLNRPKVLNACDLDTLAQLHTLLKWAQADADVRCLVITGSGRGFCVGADLSALKDSLQSPHSSFSYREHLKNGFNPVILSIRNFDRPTIAMVNGFVAGGGLGIALACDVRFAAKDASFVEAFTKVGLVPDCGVSYFLPRYVGSSKAFELIYTGDGISGGEILQYGLASRILPAEDLERETMEFAAKISKGPTKALSLAKREVRKAESSSSLEDALEFEAYMQELAGKTKDHKEGISAFLEKRPPRFSGN